MYPLSDQPDPQRQNENQAEPGNLILFDLRQLTRFSDKGPLVQVLSDIGVARLILFTFKSGQKLQDQQTSSQVIVQVLRGRATLTTSGNSVKLQAGMVLQLEADIPHNVLAQTDAVMLLTLTPAPLYLHLGLDQEAQKYQHLTPLVKRTTEA